MKVKVIIKSVTLEDKKIGIRIGDALFFFDSQKIY